MSETKKKFISKSVFKVFFFFWFKSYTQLKSEYLTRGFLEDANLAAQVVLEKYYCYTGSSNT